MEFVTKGMKSAGLLDYVAGWYLKAAQYVSSSQIGEASRDRKQFADVKFAAVKTSRKPVDATTDDLFISFDRQDAANRLKVRCAFVSTNSIAQGEQVGVLWAEMLRMGMHIQFAHRTFQWTNDAPGKAAVHCIIVGFGASNLLRKQIWHYDDVRGKALPIDASNINPYLVDADDILLPARRRTLCAVAEPRYGSFALDDGNLTISELDRAEILKEEPAAEKYLRPFLGGQELLHNQKRWCLWLEKISPAELQTLPSIRRRVDAVRKWREQSDRPTTKKLAQTPTAFAEIRQPQTSYLALPTTSSETREFLPIAFLPADVIASNQLYVVPDATPFHFGVLTSTMHMAWMRFVCGRLESRYRYSNTIVYNNFPWPSAVNSLSNKPFAHIDQAHTAIKKIAIVKTDLAVGKLIAKIEATAQAVLDARAVHQTGGASATLAQLYDPSLMPANLAKAHAALDKAVDAAYLEDGGQSSYANDGERVAFLFKRYAALTSLV